MVFPHMLRTGKAGQVMIAEEGIHENGTKTQKAGLQLIWKKDTALFLRKES